VAAPEHVVDPYAHDGPWTEQDWLELPESRVELVDGVLVMSPNPANRHQRLTLRIGALLDAAAPQGWDVLLEPNVRLATDRDLIPDLAIVTHADMDTVINDAADVVLVVEIVSPGNAAYDRILKPRLYAEAGIRWYLRIEPTALTGHLHELRDGAYVEVAHGTTVELTEPFTVVVDLPHLLR
jgi:Uma2 family endonuclease